jgi:hypothetical protein
MMQMLVPQLELLEHQNIYSIRGSRNNFWLCMYSAVAEVFQVMSIGTCET